MKRWVGTTLCLVGCLLAVATNGADSRSVDDLDGLAAELLADSSMPSIAVAAGDSRGLLALGAAGKRRVNDTVAVTRTDRFHLGSDTKAMTAVLAATFVQEGKLEWTSTLRELFPDLKTMREAYYDVTLEELLAHRSGLTGSIAGDHPDVWERLWKNEGPVDEQRRWFVDTMLSMPPSTKPREKYQYSNAGFIVAGAALERIAGETWERLMQKRLFDPLGMASCGFGAPGKPEGADDAPWGHVHRSNGLVPMAPGFRADNPPALGPAGTVHCSLPDWGSFIADQLAGLRGKGRLLKKAAAYKELHPADAGYAFGWGVTSRDWAGGETWTHAGSNTMWYAIAWVSPATDRFYLAATNVAAPTTPSELDKAFGPMIAKYGKSKPR